MNLRQYDYQKQQLQDFLPEDKQRRERNSRSISLLLAGYDHDGANSTPTVDMRVRAVCVLTVLFGVCGVRHTKTRRNVRPSAAAAAVICDALARLIS